MDKPIFIVGPHRSGSTVWHNLVAMCPGVLRLTDSRFLSRPGQRDFRFFLDTQVRDLSRDEDVDRMVEMCFSKKTIPGLEGAFWRFEGIQAAENPALRQEIAHQIKHSNRSIGAIVRILLEEITRFSGYDRACVKFPVDVGHIPELVAWFPNCKIVHITRDPRALAMSKSNDPAGTAIKVIEHPRLAWLIRKAAVWFTIAQYRLAAKLHGRFQALRNYKLFRYEDLLAEPEKTVRELCDFIEVDFTEEMLELEKGRHEHQPSSLTGKRQKAFDPAAATRWKKIISPTDKLVISCLTRGSMRKFGYNPKTHPIFRKPEESAHDIQRQSAFSLR
jgi:Sulfotransferase family